MVSDRVVFGADFFPPDFSIFVLGIERTHVMKIDFYQIVVCHLSFGRMIVAPSASQISGMERLEIQQRHSLDCVVQGAHLVDYEQC